MEILKNVQGINNSLRNLNGRLTNLELEFQENGGHSTRDRLKRMEKKLNRLLGEEEPTGEEI